MNINNIAFNSIQHFRESVESGEEFTLYLNNKEYYIGYFDDDSVISEPFGVNTQIFDTFEHLLDLDLGGLTLRENWQNLRTQP